MTREEQLCVLCQELIRRPSLSGQEQACARFLQETMERLGYDQVTVDRWGSVVGRLRGRRPGQRILLDGHMDTVPAEDTASWHHPPFSGEVENGRIYGRGASDMKGSVAAMVLAAAALARDTGGDFAGELYVSCSVQEECFEGVACREILQAVKPDCVIVGEATDARLNIGQRGRAEVVLETQGVSCHSSNPEKGVNAVYLMAELIRRIQALVPKTHPLLGSGILELTDIRSDPYPGASVVPGRCRATFDRRLLTGETEEDVLAPLEAVIRQAQAELPRMQARAFLAEGESVCWTGEVLRAKRFFPAWALEPEHPLVQQALEGLRSAGINAPLGHYAFCTNASAFCGEAGIPTVGFGPSPENLAHTADEYIEIAQLQQAFRGFYGILSRLSAG